MKMSTPEKDDKTLCTEFAEEFAYPEGNDLSRPLCTALLSMRCPQLQSVDCYQNPALSCSLASS